jgi:hypothetical protein
LACPDAWFTLLPRKPDLPRFDPLRSCLPADHAGSPPPSADRHAPDDRRYRGRSAGHGDAAVPLTGCRQTARLPLQDDAPRQPGPGTGQCSGCADPHSARKRTDRAVVPTRYRVERG